MNRLEEISVSTVPHMEDQDRETVISGYQRQLDDIIDLSDSDDFSALEDLKKIFNQT